MTRMMGQDGPSGSLGMTQSWGCGRCPEGHAAMLGHLDRLEKGAGMAPGAALDKVLPAAQRGSFPSAHTLCHILSKCGHYTEVKHFVMESIF